uniref:Uncharacterized protein n=1 Tax=Arundo donax TaxID=35708 RepID=A0A0A9GAA3_ARUDO
MIPRCLVEFLQLLHGTKRCLKPTTPHASHTTSILQHLQKLLLRRPPRSRTRPGSRPEGMQETLLKPCAHLPHGWNEVTRERGSCR